MANPGSNREAIDNPRERERPVKALLRLTETAAFLRSTDGRFFARVQVGGRPEIYALGSPPFRSWLIDSYFGAYGEVVSDWSIRRALAKLEATARFEGGTPPISTRVGHEGESPHESVGAIESCSDELMNGDPDAAQIPAMA